MMLGLANSLVSSNAPAIGAPYTPLEVFHITTFLSSTSYYNSVRTSATQGNIYGDGHLHHFLSLQGNSMGYVRDGSASATQGAGQYNFGVTGITLATAISNGLLDRCLDACQAAGEDSGGYAIVTAQCDPNGLANGNSAVDILARVATMVERALEHPRVIIVLMQIPPRLDAVGEAAILVQRNLVNAGLVSTYGNYHRRVKVLECGAFGDDGDGYMLPEYVDTLNHPETPLGAMIGGLLWDDFSTDADIVIPDPLDLNVVRTSYGRNQNPSLTGNASAATSWTTAEENGSTYGSALAFEDYADSSGRRKAILVAAANSTNGTIRFYQSGTGLVTSAMSAGDVVECFCEVDLVESGFAIGSMRLNLTSGGSSVFTECGTSRTAAEAPPVAIPYNSRKRILRSMPVVPSGAITSLFPSFRVYGSGTVKVGTIVVAVNRPSPDFLYVP